MGLTNSQSIRPLPSLSGYQNIIACVSDGGSDFRIYEGSDLKTYLLMRWLGIDALAVVRPTEVNLSDLFALVFSLCTVESVIFAFSPFYILVYMF